MPLSRISLTGQFCWYKNQKYQFCHKKVWSDVMSIQLSCLVQKPKISIGILKSLVRQKIPPGVIKSRPFRVALNLKSPGHCGYRSQKCHFVAAGRRKFVPPPISDTLVTGLLQGGLGRGHFQLRTWGQDSRLVRELLFTRLKLLLQLIQIFNRTSYIQVAEEGEDQTLAEASVDGCLLLVSNI